MQSSVPRISIKIYNLVTINLSESSSNSVTLSDELSVARKSMTFSLIHWRNNKHGLSSTVTHPNSNHILYNIFIFISNIRNQTLLESSIVPYTVPKGFNVNLIPNTRFQTSPEVSKQYEK